VVKVPYVLYDISATKSRWSFVSSPKVDRQTEKQSNRNKRMDLTRFFCDNLTVNTWRSVRDRSGEDCYTEWMGAAKEGDLTKIILLHLQRAGGCTTRAMDYAACKGHLDVVIWLHENRSEGCTWAMDYAVCCGHLDVVEWLKEHAVKLGLNKGDAQ
jgi:hypothetical protein